MRYGRNPWDAGTKESLSSRIRRANIEAYRIGRSKKQKLKLVRLLNASAVRDGAKVPKEFREFSAKAKLSPGRPPKTPAPGCRAPIRSNAGTAAWMLLVLVGGADQGERLACDTF